VDLNVKVTKVPESAGGSDPRFEMDDVRTYPSASIGRSLCGIQYNLKKVFWIIMFGQRRCDQDVPQHGVYYAAVHGGKRTITPLPNVQIQRGDKNSEPHFKMV
jgi:hypothetical protein